MHLKHLFWPPSPWSITRSSITVIIIFLSWFMLVEIGDVGPLTIVEKYLTINYDSKTTGSIVLSTSRLKGGGRYGSINCKYYIRYTYEVNNVLYLGDMVHLGSHMEPGHCGKDAQKALEKYPVGKEVTVYYDPSSPEDSLLENNGIDTKRLVFQSLACFVLSLFTLWGFRGD